MIDDTAIRLLTASGFDAEFFKNLAFCETHAQAYEKTEQLFHQYFGKNKYKSFDSFRKSRDRRLQS